MCPVRSVTYVSGRSNNLRGSNIPSLGAIGCNSKLSNVDKLRRNTRGRALYVDAMIFAEVDCRELGVTAHSNKSYEVGIDVDLRA